MDIIENQIDKLSEIKKVLNYTHCSVQSNVIKFNRMFFVYFNDTEEHIELHCSDIVEFKKTGNLNKNTLILSIPYKTILDDTLEFCFDKKGKIEKVSLGFHIPKITFCGLFKKTSHSFDGKINKDLFIVEDGFKLYHDENEKTK